MAEKATMVKQLKFYVDTYKKEEKYRKGELGFCGMFNTGIQMSNVGNVFKIAKRVGADVEINDWNHKIWTKQVSVVYEGVNFFALGTNEEASHET